LKHQFYLLLILGLLSACQQKIAQSTASHPETPATTTAVRMIQKIELLSLEAINLSEDMSLLSTHNDEILLIAYLLQKEVDSLKILDAHLFKDLTFDTLTTKHALPYRLIPHHDSSAQFMAAFLLVELDNTDTENRIQETFNRKITQYVDGQAPSRLALDSLFGTDDFLGLEFLRFDQPYQEGEQELIFKGMHLFDRFEYRLQYQLY
jgi:hypothetical protein